MANKKRIFNLLKPILPPKTVWDKVYDWVINRARVVVLIAEVFIVVAFAVKVGVDTNAKNKQKNIDRLTREISIYAVDKEPKFRQLFRIDSDYVRLWEISSNNHDVITEIYSYIKNPASDITVRIDKNRVSIFGTEDLRDLQELEIAVENSETFANAYIDTLTVEDEDLQTNTGQYVLIATIDTELIHREQIRPI